MAPAAVRFEGATKRYGALTALDSLTLEVLPGALFALVGPNGAGKTTAIGLVTGLLSPTAGRVFVLGTDVSVRPREAKRHIGFVPDRPWLWPKWTPRETLRFIGAVFGLTGPVLEERIEEELAAAGLGGASELPNESLSHGMRQRVALAQAFLHDPDVLVLDEPMVGLDPVAQRSLGERLRERADSGAAVLFTTHQLAQAEELATSVGVLVKGRLAATGPPGALRDSSGRTGALREVFFRSLRDGEPP